MNIFSMKIQSLSCCSNYKILFRISFIDVLLFIFSIFALVATSPNRAYAYVDPSVMTYTIQAIAGVTVALSAVIGIAFRRSRKVIFRLFNIDENANKQVDPIVHGIGDTTDEAKDFSYSLLDRDKFLKRADIRAQRIHANLVKGRVIKNLKWPSRFLLSLLASFFFIGTVFIVSPLEVVVGNADSLRFNIFNALQIVIGAGLISSIVLSLVISLLRGKVFNIVFILLVALGACCYIQSLFLNFSLPIADGRSLDLLEYKRITVVSSLVWFALIFAALILSLTRTNLATNISLSICIVMIVVQTFGVFGAINSVSPPDGEIVQTKNGLYEIGTKSNVIMFVLDTVDTDNINIALEEEPDMFKNFTGFTYFKNSTGSMIPTRYGIPYLLTGNLPDGTKGFFDFIETWYTDSSFISDIASQGYGIGVYSDSVESGWLKDKDIEGEEVIAKYAKNFKIVHDRPINTLGLLKELDKVALYRNAPWLLKPLFWFYSDDINKASISLDSDDSLTQYTLDDIAFLNDIKSNGLKTSESEKEFRFIHLQGAHSPYITNKDGSASEVGTDVTTVTIGSFAIISSYLEELKKLGLYDEATIIVTSDHGYWGLVPEYISSPSSACLLVKPSEDAEQASKPISVSSVPTGHLDIPATIIDAVGGDSSLYGKTVFEISDEPRERYYWMTSSNGRMDTWLRQFKINGDVLDFDNWTPTGSQIEIVED